MNGKKILFGAAYDGLLFVFDEGRLLSTFAGSTNIPIGSCAP